MAPWGFEKTLQDVVKGIRANKRDPSDYISSTIAEIKVELKSSDAFIKAQAVRPTTLLRSAIQQFTEQYSTVQYSICGSAAREHSWVVLLGCLERILLHNMPSVERPFPRLPTSVSHVTTTLF